MQRTTSNKRKAPPGAIESSPAEPVLSLPKETAGLVGRTREQSRQGRMNNSSSACSPRSPLLSRPCRDSIGLYTFTRQFLPGYYQAAPDGAAITIVQTRLASYSNCVSMDHTFYQMR